jgi:uncharacterized SAM-binding protein YcdF (DUF218 family)
MVRKYLRVILQAIGIGTVVATIAGVVTVFALGGWLQFEPPLQKADYIVPLAGDDHRFLKAVELYKDGWAPMILLSNARVHSPSRIEMIEAKLGQPRLEPHQFRKLLLDYLGVPASATAEFGSGHVSTVEEAEALRNYLGDRDATVILVTSPYHARRAMLTFGRVMPKMHFLVASPPEGRLHDPWWRDRDSAVQAITEVAKLTFFWLGGSFRAEARAQ